MRHVRGPEQLTPGRRCPVENNTTDVAAARLGAACLGVRHSRSPWANLAVVGANHARTQNAVTGRWQPGRASPRVLAAPGPDAADRPDELPSCCRPLMAPVSRTSRRPASTPAVTARWVHILNGNNRPRKAGQDPRKAVDPHIGSAAKLFCRPGPNRPAPAQLDQQSERGWHRCSGPTPRPRRSP